MVYKSLPLGGPVLVVVSSQGGYEGVPIYVVFAHSPSPLQLFAAVLRHSAFLRVTTGYGSGSFGFACSNGASMSAQVEIQLLKWLKD